MKAISPSKVMHPTQRGEIQSAIVETTTPSYFGMMNIALRDGRFLSDADGPDTQQAAVVSASLVRTFLRPAKIPSASASKSAKPKTTRSRTPG